MGLFTTDYRSNVAGPDASAFQLPNADVNRAQLAAAMQQSQQRQAPGVSFNTLGPQDQMRQQQMGFAQALQQQATGQGGPSAAQLQMNQGLAQGLQQQMAMAASARGGVNPATMQRDLMNNQALMAQQNNAQTGVLRAQEQLSAQQQLGQALAQGRQQDIGVSQLGLQAQGMNQQAGLQQQGLNDQLTQFYTQAGLTQDQAQLQAAMEMQRQRQATAMGNSQINAGIEQGNASVGRDILGGLMNAGGAIGGAALGGWLGK